MRQHRIIEAGSAPPEPLRGFIERVVVPILLERFLVDQAVQSGPDPDSPSQIEVAA